ncbi:helix-turn-helix domain-containing protein, partial [Limosilactobacillus fermentum]
MNFVRFLDLTPVIETLHNEGRSLRYIANYLGFSKTTIFN